MKINLIKFASPIENIVSVTHGMLSLLSLKVSITSVKDSLYNDPHYPSLLSINQCFKRFGLDTLALETTLEQLPNFPTPFIVHLTDPANPFRIIEAIQNDHLVISDDIYSKRKMSIEEFKQTWSGVALLGEVVNKVDDESYKLNKLKEWSGRYSVITIFGIFLILGLIKTLNRFSFINLGLMCLFLSGGIISGLLILYEYDKYNPLVSKACSIEKQFNCAAILNSNASRIIGNLSWTDLGFIYFTGSYLFLLMRTNSALDIFAVSSLLSLPYVIFSLFYQGRIAKQWCPFCLAAQAVLVLIFVLVIITDRLEFSSLNIISDLPLFLLALLIPSVGWLSAKPLLFYRKVAETKIHDLTRFKNNPTVFETILHAQNRLTDVPLDLGITLGNLDAPNTLINVCNPFCSACASIHPKIKTLIERSNDWKVQFIFTATGNESDDKTAVASYFMEIAKKSSAGQTEVLKSISDWYNAVPETFPTEEFKNRKFEYLSEIRQMNTWCNLVKISHTPTFYVNGYMLPSLYEIDDLTNFSE